ncbi:MAG: response regulator [Deltaproteobacteria bacterium]|nr:response regulator [Deltaproteobacteria bacterium]
MEKSHDSKPTGKTILIVDDELGVLEVVEYILADLGHRVISAINGRDALARIKDASPDLVILDYMMPVMDGAAVINAIRADEKYCDIPVILTSALAESTVRQKCPGYNVFLRKPYQLEKLVEAISSLIPGESPVSG